MVEHPNVLHHIGFFLVPDSRDEPGNPMAEPKSTMAQRVAPAASPLERAERRDLLPRHVRMATAVAVAAPFAAFVVAMVWLWGWSVSWTPPILLLAMSVLTALGITVGFHRLLTHRAFEPHRPVRALLGVLGSMAAGGPLLKWVAVHRQHHQHSDHREDPHSPRRHDERLFGLFGGLWHAHIGWMFERDAPGLSSYVPDLAADPLVRRLSSLFALWVLVGLLIPTVLGGLLMQTWSGALLGFLWGGLVRIFLVHHLTWSINSVCHVWGSRPFRTRDHSRNNALFGVLGLGEGWHNNHHAFPTSARHGLRWGQFDLSYLVIRLLVLTGLVWDVRLPAAQAMAGKRRGVSAHGPDDGRAIPSGAAGEASS